MLGQSFGLSGSVLWPQCVSPVASVGQSCGTSGSVLWPIFLKGFLIDCTVSWSGVGEERGLRCFQHGLVVLYPTGHMRHVHHIHTLCIYIYILYI